MELNGVSLEGLNNRIKIVDIIEHPPKRVTQVADRAKYHGLLYLGTVIEERVVEVQFTISIKDMNLRRILLDTILDHFEQGGRLVLQNRDGMYLNVVCTEAPAIDSLRDYWSTLTLEFTSYQPFWKAIDRTLASVNLTAETEGTVNITPPGNLNQIPLEFTLLNTSGSTIDTLDIDVNGYEFSFTGLGLADAETLTCEYDDDGFLVFRIGETGVMNKRIGDDDLLLNSRENNTVSATSEGAATLTVYARGLWK